MQEGRSFADLCAEIERRDKAARDFVAPANKLEMVLENDRPALALRGEGVALASDPFPLGRYAGGQVAEKLKIPKKYFDKCAEQAPDLLARNVNHWLHNTNGNKHLLRTLDGEARAFLSDGYRPIDNIVVASGVFNEIEKSGVQVKVISGEITERRLYIQLVTPQVEARVSDRQVNDLVQAGLTISNSEIGQGQASFESLLYFLICLNGQKGTKAFKKMHIGGRLGNTSGAAVVEFSAQTLRYDNKAFLSAMEDMTRVALSDMSLQEDMLKLKEAQGREMKVEAVQETIKEVQKVHSLTDTEAGGILGRLIQQGELTQFGLSAAVTNLANDAELVPDYDRVVEMQSIGADLMFMSGKDFDALNKRAEVEHSIASA